MLQRILPEDATLYVGNSLAIRQMEIAWRASASRTRVLCNRGANGIDGFVSSVLGAAAATTAPVVGVLGDLSFYHDLNGLLAAKRYRLNATFIILNNDGGGIFSMLPQASLSAIFDEFFTTPHGLDFSHSAALYDCDFARVTSLEALDTSMRTSLKTPGTQIIEIPIDRDQDLAAMDLRGVFQFLNDS